MITVFCFLALICSVYGIYLNPVLNRDFPDPCVVKAADNNYFVYGTQTGGVNLQGARSSDGVNWQWIGEVLPNKPSWGKNSNRFWAPDVQLHGDTFYMYFAAAPDNNPNGMCIGVATSNNPAGPFNPTSQPIVCSNGFSAIDPKSFDDPNTGKIYLFWGSDFAPISVQELSADRLSLAPNSSPKAIIFPSNARYHHLVEGAWMHQKYGFYYLFFSGDNCCGPSASYAVMVSRSANITGPFEEAPDLVIQLNNKWVAPGHNAILTDNDGVDWLYYHSIDKDEGNYYVRKLLMDRLFYTPETVWPYVDGRTPSTTKQQSPNLS